MASSEPLASFVALLLVEKIAKNRFFISNLPDLALVRGIFGCQNSFFSSNFLNNVAHPKYFSIFGFVVRFRIEWHIICPIWMIGSQDIRGNVFSKSPKSLKTALQVEKKRFFGVSDQFFAFFSLSNQKIVKYFSIFGILRQFPIF